jgi:AcrR family transcriptional regulator
MPTAKTTLKKAPDLAGEGECPTKTVILDITEELIGRSGVRAVSVRDIARAAGINLAAINYHFGSKVRLLRAVLERRMSDLFGRRMVALDAVERIKGGPTAETLMRAFLAPCMAFDAKAKRRHEGIAKMMSRFFFEEEELVGAVAIAQFEPFRVRFTTLLKKAIPSVSADELDWRSSLAMGVLHHHLLFAATQERVLRKRVSPEVEMQRLLSFCAAGLRAPPSDARKGMARKGAPRKK